MSGPLQADSALAVEPQQVVLGKTEATDGCVGFQATMWPMPIVAMEPMEHFGRPLIGVVIGVSVSPFAQRRLDKALGLSVGPRGVGLGEDLAETEAFAGGPEGL
jgi:hypothetical protein